MSFVTDTSLDGLRVLALENEFLALSILPQVGAKVMRLYDKGADREVLWANPRVRPQRFPVNVGFDDYWCGGWDDAYPTAYPCLHKGDPFPHLGELRSLDWTVEELRDTEKGGVARLSAFGPISPIKATKTVELDGRNLAMTFEVENLSHVVVDYLWGTHPAFAIQPGTRLLLPARTGIVQEAKQPVLGTPGERYAWPNLRGRDMSIVPSDKEGTACGHYAVDLEDGSFAVETNGEGIVFDFSLEKCPYLWMWLVYGGWRGHYVAIVEPWTGYPVDLEQAFQQKRHSELAPGGKFEVTVRCTTYRAPEDHHKALARLRSS